MSKINFAETFHLMKFPAELMKHDPMGIPASSAIPHTINHPSKLRQSIFPSAGDTDEWPA
jgi:hypothetical protein